MASRQQVGEFSLKATTFTFTPGPTGFQLTLKGYIWAAARDGQR